jgi:NADPH:quinone reductase-like Zn-dependent oxidoreductase
MLLSPGPVRSATELLALLGAGAIRPIAAARVPLAEAADAREILERGGCGGKVVLVTTA